jgi:hypothetical protein
MLSPAKVAKEERKAGPPIRLSLRCRSQTDRRVSHSRAAGRDATNTGTGVAHCAH